MVSLFANVHLDEKIYHIYDKKEINTNTFKKMRSLLYFCIKNANVTINNKKDIQGHGIAIALPLILFLSNIFMLELKQNVTPA